MVKRKTVCTVLESRHSGSWTCGNPLAKLNAARRRERVLYSLDIKLISALHFVILSDSKSWTCSDDESVHPNA